MINIPKLLNGKSWIFFLSLMLFRIKVEEIFNYGASTMNFKF
jgi:hypothetical protein